MKKIFLSALSIVCFTQMNKVSAQEKEVYVFDKKIAVPGSGGYDYLSIDMANNHLFVSHGTAVNVIDLATEAVIATIDNMEGVHGIAIDNSLNRGFITDGKANSIVAFDLKTFKKIKTIPLTGKGADAIMFDPFSKKVFSFNGDSDDASVVDAKSLEQVGSVALGGGPEFAVSNGKGLIYNNIEDKSTVVTIDAKTLKVINTFPLAPSGKPTGLMLDSKNKRLFSGCRTSKNVVVLDAETGKIITTLPIGSGVDAVAYDTETKLIFCSNGDATTTIIKQNSADSYQIVQTLKTQPRAKTLALDTKTHKIYLSCYEFEKGTKTPIAGTFGVLVYKMK